MKTKCNHCNKEYKIENKYDGYLMECPECKESFIVEKLDNILIKKSTKGIIKKNPALVGAACCLFFAIVLNFISNFFFFLWGPLYLVVFILGILAIVQQRPLKGIGFIVTSLLLPLIISLVNVFWVGAVLSDAVKKKNQRNFYQASAKSKKTQMDFFNTDPFANSFSRKKQIRKNKYKYSQGKIEKAQKKLKPINKPVIVLTAPASPKEPKVSIVSSVSFKKRDEVNKNTSISVYSGFIKPQPIINTKKEVKVSQISPVLFKKSDINNPSSKKIIERLILKNFSRKNKNYTIKLVKIIKWSKNKKDWRVEIKFRGDNRKWKNKFVKLDDIFKFRKDRYKLVNVSVPSYILNKKTSNNTDYFDSDQTVSKKSNKKITIMNLDYGEKKVCRQNSTIRFSDVYAHLIDTYTQKKYSVKNRGTLILGNNTTETEKYKVSRYRPGGTTYYPNGYTTQKLPLENYITLINAKGKKYIVRKSSNLKTRSFQQASGSRIKRIIVGQNGVAFK